MLRYAEHIAGKEEIRRSLGIQVNPIAAEYLHSQLKSLHPLLFNPKVSLQIAQDGYLSTSLSVGLDENDDDADRPTVIPSIPWFRIHS